MASSIERKVSQSTHLIGTNGHAYTIGPNSEVSRGLNRSHETNEILLGFIYDRQNLTGEWNTYDELIVPIRAINPGQITQKFSPCSYPVIYNPANRVYCIGPAIKEMKPFFKKQPIKII